MYTDIIINILKDASINSLCNNFSAKSKTKRQVIGWNIHVRGAHRVARLKFLNWV